MEREIFLMKLCTHHYVVRLLDTFEDRRYVHLVTELEQGGTLQSYLSERNNLIKEERAKEIAQKLAQAIVYIHEYGILLGRLDPTTIMMTDRTDSAVPRIMNLSKAVILPPDSKVLEQVGQVLYFAPEICQNKEYDYKVDIWSFGCILYFLLSGTTHVQKVANVKTL